MSKIIGAAVAVTVMAVAIVAWSKFAVIKPEAPAATNATAAENPSAISFFDIMIMRGKNLPVENAPAN